MVEWLEKGQATDLPDGAVIIKEQFQPKGRLPRRRAASNIFQYMDEQKIVSGDYARRLEPHDQAQGRVQGRLVLDRSVGRYDFPGDGLPEGRLRPILPALSRLRRKGIYVFSAE